MPTMGVKSGQIKSINRQTMQQTWRRKRVKCNKNTSHKAKRVLASKHGLHCCRKMQNNKYCILLWKFSDSIPSSIWVLIKCAKLNSSRVRSAGLDSKASWAHSTVVIAILLLVGSPEPGNIKSCRIWPQKWPKGQDIAYSTHTLARHLTTFEKSYEYYGKVCRRNVLWGVPLFLWPRCVHVCVRLKLLFFLFISIYEIFICALLWPQFSMQVVGAEYIAF